MGDRLAFHLRSLQIMVSNKLHHAIAVDLYYDVYSTDIQPSELIALVNFAFAYMFDG